MALQTGMKKAETTQGEFIDSPQALASVVDEAKKRDAVALDTEFLSERTYYPQPGLIQLALSDEECYLIDPLAIDNLHPLGELLVTENVVKIFHDAPQDLAILAKATSATPHNIFDTRLAAGFAGLPGTLSLAKLIHLLLEIEIDKSATRTNWLKRPLSEKQLLYATEDVRYLRAIRVILLARITTPEVRRWLAQELSALDNPQTYNFFNPQLRYKKIRGAGRLNNNELALLKKLCIWRENLARQKNRPRGHILQDRILLEMAKKQPKTVICLENCGLSKKAINRYASELITIAAQTGQRKRQKIYSASKPKKMTSIEKDTLAALSRYIRLKSDTLGIDPAIVANKASQEDLARTIAAGNSPAKDSKWGTGWREKFIHDFIA